jgi:hypothetical protein
MTKNTTENNGNARNDTQLKLKTLNYLDGDDEQESPAKLTHREEFKEAPVKLTHRETFKKSIPFQHSNRYIESVKACNIKDHTADSTKNFNQDLSPSTRFQKTTVEMGRDKVIDKINLFGGNLQKFLNIYRIG